MKNRKVVCALLVFMVCMMLCGCGISRPVIRLLLNKGDRQEKRVEEEVEEERAEENIDEEQVKEAEESPEMLEKEETEKDEACFPSVSEEIYQPLLDGVYERILSEDGDTDMELVAEADYGIFEAGYDLTPEETLENVGYVFDDLNQDGISELILGSIEEEKLGHFYGSNIIAIYTCQEEEIKFVCAGWSRNYVGWLGENRFCELGSAGAAYSVMTEYEFLPEETELHCIDQYFTEEDGIYHNQTGSWDLEDSELSDMDGDEFWTLWDDYRNSSCSFELIPFSHYSYAGGQRGERQEQDETVTVSWADEMMATYDDYDEFDAYDGADQVWVAFSTTDDVKNFKLLSLQYESMDEDGKIQYSVTELLNYGDLKEDCPLVVSMILEGTIPGYGISYEDMQGNRRMYSVNLSGYDGSLFLMEESVE